MASPQIPEFAILAAAHELAAHLTDPGTIDVAAVAEQMLKVALPHMSSPRLRLEARAALYETFAEAMRETPQPDLAELADDAYNIVEPFLRGAPPPTVHEVTWHRRSWQKATHVEFIPAHYVAYEETRVRFHQETDEAGYVLLLDADRSDIRTIRRVPQDGEPVPTLVDEDEDGAS